MHYMKIICRVEKGFRPVTEIRKAIPQCKNTVLQVKVQAFASKYTWIAKSTHYAEWPMPLTYIVLGS